MGVHSIVEIKEKYRCQLMGMATLLRKLRDSQGTILLGFTFLPSVSSLEHEFILRLG